MPLDEAPEGGEREAIYPLSEGMTSRRLAALAAQAVERAPELPEWIEPSLKAKHDWPDWQRGAGARSTPIRRTPRRATRLAYDEVFANQLALMLVRGEARRKRGRALVGDGRLRDVLKLPYAPTGAQARTIARDRGRSGAERSRCCGCCRAMSGRARRWSR